MVFAFPAVFPHSWLGSMLRRTRKMIWVVSSVYEVFHGTTWLLVYIMVYVLGAVSNIGKAVEELPLNACFISSAPTVVLDILPSGLTKARWQARHDAKGRLRTVLCTEYSRPLTRRQLRLACLDPSLPSLPSFGSPGSISKFEPHTMRHKTDIWGRIWLARQRTCRQRRFSTYIGHFLVLTPYLLCTIQRITVRLGSDCGVEGSGMSGSALTSAPLGGEGTSPLSN
jgi:hypothetical protein